MAKAFSPNRVAARRRAGRLDGKKMRSPTGSGPLQNQKIQIKLAEE